MDEIERRFLVTRISSKNMFPFGLKSRTIRQGYFDVPSSLGSLRVRISDSDSGIASEMTIKKGKGIKRTELNCPILDSDFSEAAFNMCANYLEKNRYKSGRWEIDCFKPPLDGLIIAEIELHSEDEEFIFPSWMAESIEVTDSLTNHHLARLATFLKQNRVPVMPYIYAQVFSKIPKIVITGGPCSGKSTILKEILDSTDSIQCVPEVATIVIDRLKITPNVNTGNNFQSFLNSVQNLFDSTSIQYAILEGKKCVLFDRGTVDGAAYMSGGLREFEKVLNTAVEDEYAKYDMVICLGVPPKDVYDANASNNPARSEDHDEALVLGQKIIDVWSRHQNFIFIGNDGGWDKKAARVREAIDNFLKVNTA